MNGTIPHPIGTRYTHLMRDLLQLYVEICLLRKGPQELPASSFLLQCCIVLYVVSGAVLLSVEMGLLQGLIQALVETALLLAFLLALLRVFEKSERFLQSATAAMGSGAIMTVLTLPLLLWVRTLQNAGADLSMASLLLLAVLAWSFVILGHILRHALNRSRFTGMALAFCYMAVSYQIMFRLFPPS